MIDFPGNKLFWLWCYGAVLPVLAFFAIGWLFKDVKVSPTIPQISLLGCYCVGVGVCLIATWCAQTQILSKIIVSVVSFVFPIFLLIFLMIAPFLALWFFNSFGG